MILPDRMRVPGVDLARGFALLAVFIAHTAPVDTYSPLALRWLQISDHVAAPLFTLLLGISAGLAWQSSGSGDSRAFRRSFALRGVSLIVLGILAGFIGAAIIPILHYLGVVSLLLLPLFTLRARWLLALAAGMTVVSAALMPVVGSTRMELIIHALTTPETAWFDNTIAMLLGFCFSDYGYRVSGLLVFALVGLAIARIGFAGRRPLGIALAGAGLVAVAVAGYALTGWSLAPYSGTAAELMKATGLACLALAACCGLSSTPLTRILTPMSALGTLTLTFYLAHILVLGIWARTTSAPDDSWPMVLALCAGSLLGAWLLRRRWRHGPAEWLVATISRPRTIARARARV